MSIINKNITTYDKYIYYTILLMFFASISPLTNLIGLPNFIVATGWYQILLGLLIVLYCMFKTNTLSQVHPFIVFFYILIAYMSIMGKITSYSVPIYFREDFLVYFRFAIFMHLGYNLKNYNSIRKGFMLVLKLAIFINMISLVAENINIRLEVSEMPLAYSMQNLLLCSIFFLFQLDYCTKREKIWIIIAFSVYIIEQIVFQKRAPIVRVLVVFVLFLINEVIVNKKSVALLLRYLLITLIFFPILLFIIQSLGINIIGYYDSLISRFYDQGTIEGTIESDARIEFGDIFIQDLEKTKDIWLGRGFSSVVFDDKFLEDESTGLKFRTVTEMGIPTILLKGGYFLLSYYLLFFSRMLILRKKLSCNPISNAAFLFLFVWFSFIYIEGTIGALSVFNEIVIAYCMGIVLTPYLKLKQKHYVWNTRYNF